MKRREFIRLIGAASTVSVFSVARSQEAGRTRRIGILADAPILAAFPRGEWQAFLEELAAGGFVEGTNLQLDRRGFSHRLGSGDGGHRVGAFTTGCNSRARDHQPRTPHSAQPAAFPLW